MFLFFFLIKANSPVYRVLTFPRHTAIVFAMRHVRFVDLLIIAAAVAVIIAASVDAYSGGSEAPAVEVRVEGREWIYDLETDRTVKIPGPLGDTAMIIEDGHVHVQDSPCQAKICVAAGEISQTNEWIICLPNRVFISIVGTEPESGEVDEVVY